MSGPDMPIYWTPAGSLGPQEAILGQGVRPGGRGRRPDDRSEEEAVGVAVAVFEQVGGRLDQVRRRVSDSVEPQRPEGPSFRPDQVHLCGPEDTAREGVLPLASSVCPRLSDGLDDAV